MELRHLRYFLEITHDMNMTRAAERLHMSQPPLSRQMQQLEEELGAELFTRSGKQLKLTQAGKFFINKATQILKAVEETETAMKRIGQTGHSWLNIGFVPSTIYGFLPEVLRRYRSNYPEIEFNLTEHMSYHQVQALKSGQIDVGFGRLLFDDPEIKQEIVLEEDLMVVLPKNHPLSKKSSLNLRMITNEPLILYPLRPRPNYADQITALFYREGLSPQVIQEVQELQTTLGLVASGVGLTIVPKSVQKMRSGDINYIPLKSELATSPVVMMYRKNEESQEVLNFIKRIRLLSGISRGRQKNRTAK